MITTAVAQRPWETSNNRYEARLTSDPFSSVAITLTMEGRPFAGSGACGMRLIPVLNVP